MAEFDFHNIQPWQVKLERAKELLDNLRAEQEKFLSNNPYKIVVEYDNDRANGHLVLRVLQVPEQYRWPVLIGDAAHNLRSSLDHMVCLLVTRNRSQITRRNQFPIYQTAQKYWESKSQDLEGISPRAEQIIDRLRPHGEGVKSFWQLHKVDIHDKHRLLVTAVDSISKFSFRPPEIWRDLIGPENFFAHKLPHPLIDGTKIVSFQIPSTARQNRYEPESILTTIDIRFLDPTEVEGKLVSEMFEQFVCIVDKTLKILSRLL